MAILFITLCVMLLVVAAMAIGVIVGRKPIQGSCGGMSALGMETACDICGGDQAKCDEESQRVAGSANTELGYEIKLDK
jgi:uncharacterized protein